MLATCYASWISHYTINILLTISSNFVDWHSRLKLRKFFMSLIVIYLRPSILPLSFPNVEIRVYLFICVYLVIRESTLGRAYRDRCFNKCDEYCNLSMRFSYGERGEDVKGRRKQKGRKRGKPFSSLFFSPLPFQISPLLNHGKGFTYHWPVYWGSSGKVQKSSSYQTAFRWYTLHH